MTYLDLGCRLGATRVAEDALVSIDCCYLSVPFLDRFAPESDRCLFCFCYCRQEEGSGPPSLPPPPAKQKCVENVVLLFLVLSASNGYPLPPLCNAACCAVPESKPTADVSINESRGPHNQIPMAGIAKLIIFLMVGTFKLIEGENDDDAEFL